MNQTLSQLESLGASIVPAAIFKVLSLLTADTTSAEVCGCLGFKYSLNDYLAQLGPNAPEKTLADIVAEKNCPPKVQSFLETAENTPGVFDTDGNCTIDIAFRAKLRETVVSLMDASGIDVAVFPTANQGAPSLAFLETNNGIPPAGWFSSCVLSAFSGLPTITVPMGILSDSRPIGVTFLARPYQEAALLQYAYAFETAFPNRQIPSTTPPLN
jgi:amidase